MNYVKKMCILRQIKQGFSGDGKPLSGLIKIEQYCKNLAVEVSIINFAPLVTGEYYCLLSDGKGKTEMLMLRGKSLFNLLSDLDITEGFCGILCHVHTEVVPIAYGINGNRNYDWKRILHSALPPVFPNLQKDFSGEIAKTEYPLSPLKNAEETPTAPPPKTECERIPAPIASQKSWRAYDDETVASENYFEEEEDAPKRVDKAQKNAHHQSSDQKQNEETGTDHSQNDNAPRARKALKIDPDGYYLAVKEEVDKLFKTYPRDKTLNGAFSCSDWVRVKGTAKVPECLVGILKVNDRVQYICYALRAEDPSKPPEEIEKVCSFVPVSPFKTQEGFFVLFQSAASGECIKPERI